MPFQPGVAANPGGRPKKTKEQIEFEENCRKAVKTHGFKFLAEMLQSGAKQDKFKAMEIMLDRGFGKAIQINENDNYEHNALHDVSDAELIERLRNYAKLGDNSGNNGTLGVPATA